jgi:hypothetical protein
MHRFSPDPRWAIQVDKLANQVDKIGNLFKGFLDFIKKNPEAVP